jgi:hypothetical protein
LELVSETRQIIDTAELPLPNRKTHHFICLIDGYGLLNVGMLNYPRRDAAAVAIEEVKRFLESKEESNPIEKIVLVVSDTPSATSD